MDNFEKTFLQYIRKLGAGFPLYLNYCWVALKVGKGQKANESSISSLLGTDFDENDFPNQFIKELMGTCIMVKERLIIDINQGLEPNNDCFTHTYIKGLIDQNLDRNGLLQTLCTQATMHIENYVTFLHINNLQLAQDDTFIKTCFELSKSQQQDHLYLNFDTMTINDRYPFRNVMEEEQEEEEEEEEEEKEGEGQGEAPKLMEGVEDQIERSNIQQAFDEFLMTTKQKFSELIPKAINNTKFDCLRIDDIKNFMKKRYRQFLPSEAVFYYNILWEALAYYKNFNPSRELEGITKKEILGITDDLFLQKETILETFDRIRPYYNITVSN